MKISVIAIFYNSKDYVEKCISSIMSQRNVDLEIIAVDDCSTDNTCDILNNFASNDSRIRVIRHDINKGISEARNSGLRAITGDAFFLIDGDDYLPDKDSLFLLSKKFDADVDWVQGSYNVCNEYGDIIKSLIYPEHSYGDYNDICKGFSDLNFYYTHNKLINSKHKNQLFHSGCYHEDRMWLAETFNDLNRIEATNVTTYSYLVRSGQTSGKARKSRKYIDSGMKLMRIMAKCPECWTNLRDTFQIVDIEKPLYLWGKDKKLRIDTIQKCNELNSVKISTDCFPRATKLIHSMIKKEYPDFIINLLSKGYLKVMNFVNKPI